MRKHTFKNIDKFFLTMMDKPVFDKGLVHPDKLICLSKTCVSNAQGSPRGMLMPSPWDRDKTANAPPPGLTTWTNAPRLPEGGGGRWAPLELINELNYVRPIQMKTIMLLHTNKTCLKSSSSHVKGTTCTRNQVINPPSSFSKGKQRKTSTYPWSTYVHDTFHGSNEDFSIPQAWGHSVGSTN